MRRGNATTSWTKAQERRDKRWHNERWRRWQMGGGDMRRGYITTSWTRCTRDNGVMRGGGPRWEVVSNFVEYHLKFF